MNRLTYKTYWDLLPDFSRKELRDATKETRNGDYQETINLKEKQNA